MRGNWVQVSLDSASVVNEDPNIQLTNLVFERKLFVLV